MPRACLFPWPRSPRRWLLALGLAAALGLALTQAGPHLLAEYHFRAAAKALERDHPGAARDHLAHCLRVWPDSGPAHLLAARAARLAGDAEAAERHLGACRADPRVDEGRRLERALLEAQSGALDDVEPYLRRLLGRNHPDSALIWQALTQGYLLTYRTTEALGGFGEWLRLRPGNAAALHGRGHVWLRLHQPAKAAEDFRRALEADPGHDSARLELAFCLLEGGQAGQARAHLEHLRGPGDGRPRVLEGLARAYLNLGRPDEAGSVLDDLLADHPRFVPGLRLRARLALEAGRADEAERWLRQALRAEPHDRLANFDLLRCLKALGRKEEGRRQEARLKKLDAIHRRLNELSNHEMPRAPHDPKLHAEIADIMFAIGRDELGVAWYLSALRKDPGYSHAHEALARYFERAGDPERARHHRAAARPPAPGSPSP